MKDMTTSELIEKIASRAPDRAAVLAVGRPEAASAGRRAQPARPQLA